VVVLAQEPAVGGSAAQDGVGGVSVSTIALLCELWAGDDGGYQVRGWSADLEFIKGEVEWRNQLLYAERRTSSSS